MYLTWSQAFQGSSLVFLDWVVYKFECPLRFTANGFGTPFLTTPTHFTSTFKTYLWVSTVYWEEFTARKSNL